MDKAFNLQLYVVTDRSWLNGKSLAEQVEQAISGGATMVQLREKDLTTKEFLIAAENVKQITDKYDIPLIINDRLDIALAVKAAGLHIGQDDLPAVIARRLLGPGKILGVSVANLQEAIKAVEDGADYLGAGAVFPTETKKDSGYVDDDSLKKITQTVKIPVVAIGGINENNGLKLEGSGIAGIAVVSAVFGRKDVKDAAMTMKQIAESIIKGNNHD